jgi:hypothetical protein
MNSLSDLEKLNNQSELSELEDKLFLDNKEQSEWHLDKTLSLSKMAKHQISSMKEKSSIINITGELSLYDDDSSQILASHSACKSNVEDRESNNKSEVIK